MAFLFFAPALTHGQYILEDVKDPKRYELGTLAVPVGYWSDSLKATLGVAGYTEGFIQPQTEIYEFLIGSLNGSYGAVIGLNNLQVRPIDRLFLDAQIYYFRTEADENYVPFNPLYPRQNPGDNNSGENNYIQSASNDFIGSFNFRYLLPIGSGRDTIINHYVLQEGLLHSGGSGGDGWNPFDSGRTFFELIPRFEYLDIRSPDAIRHHWDTNCLQTSFYYDNRDWPLTPSRGNQTTISITRDFGLAGSSNPWTTITADFAQYIPLGQSSVFRQEVLALDVWTSYSPTWHQRGSLGNLTTSTAPPFYEGATLGGMNKLRGYPENRFHDRAGIYGSAELRLIPYWNPLAQISMFKGADLAWIQFVAFVEVGRVADEYTFDKLMHHLKGDGGVGLRILTQDTVIRFDIAGSNEGIQFWANLDQAF